MCCKAFIHLLSISLAIALCAGGATAGTFKTHGIFSSNMVLQRDKPLNIWGWAEPGEEVTVSFAGRQTKASAAAERSWQVTVETWTPQDVIAKIDGKERGSRGDKNFVEHSFPAREIRLIKIVTHGCHGLTFPSFSRLSEVMAFAC